MSGVVSSEFIAECTEDFKKADVNGDGFLDFDEFKACLDCPPSQAKQAWNIFQKFDLDGNGKMDVDEYIAMAACLLGGGDEVDETLGEFLMIDKDHNGYITMDEFYEFLLVVDPEVAKDKDEFLATFKAFDLNGNGKIEYEEYRKISDFLEEEDKKHDKADELYEAFNEIDTDGNGYITPDEFFMFCLKYSPEVAANKDKFVYTFRTIDLDGNGKIEFAEFKKFIKSIEKATIDGKLDQNTLIFCMLDKNDDGFISVDEFYDFFAAAGLTGVITRAEVKEIFKMFDTNGDGRMSLEEFKDMVAKVQK